MVLFQEMGLYYDGNTGTYLYYNERTKTYEYHSHATVPQALVPSQPVATNHHSVTEPVVTAHVSKQPLSPVISSQTTNSIKRMAKLIEPEPEIPEIPEILTRHKSSKLKPIETEETDFHIPGSNPMAPVLSESSNVSITKERKREHKRKAKHEKLKVSQVQ